MSFIYSCEGLKFLDLITYPKIEIKEGLFSFIAGKSGCGKSTYLKILNRTIIPTCGEVFYKEDNINTFPVLSYRKKILLVPQEVFLFDGNIIDNFNLYHDIRESQCLDTDKMKEFLDICCANFDLNSDCKTLSGGEKQRVFLSIFLSFMPEVLLLDEPTAALDENTSMELLTNIKSFCKKNSISVVCVCHNDKLIESFSDDTIRLGANS